MTVQQKKLWGSVCAIVGLLAFVASAVQGSGVETEDAVTVLLSGALNPLFFIGVTLGLYWLYQAVKFSAEHSDTMAQSRSPSYVRCRFCDAANAPDDTTCHFCERPLASENHRGQTLNAPKTSRLTSCPDCGHKVSRQALSCPSCGAPLGSEGGIDSHQT